MDSNYPQHPQAQLPPNYPPNTYPGFALPTLNFSPANSPYNGSVYQHRQSYPPSSSPPAYDRYNGYNPGTGLQQSGPFINVSSPAPPRRRESLPGEGRIPPPRTDVPVETEPRMGQYMSYPQQPSQQTYEWPPLPPPAADNRGPPGSRRSTVSDHEANAGTGPSGADVHSEAGSRPNSPPKSTSFQVPKIERVDEDDGEEEKIDHRKRKRNRTIRSCVPCHNHKRKVSTLVSHRRQLMAV